MDNNNLLVAVILSVIILVGFQYIYVKPQQEHYRRQMQAEQLIEKTAPAAPRETIARDRAAVIAAAPRVPVETPEWKGSINLKGARIDDLTLTGYRETVDKTSPQITLLSPAGSAAPELPFYAESGWLAPNLAVPGADTVWRADGNRLTPARPLKLTWDNGQGLIFERTIAVDEHFMLTITDGVRNNGAAPVTLYPYGLVARQGHPPVQDLMILHEGPVGVLEGKLQEHTYDDIKEAGKKVTESTGGWLGITDKYWLVALIPPQDEKLAAEFAYAKSADAARNDGYYQADFRGGPVTVAPGAFETRALNLFAGAKRLQLLDRYESQYNLPHFDRAIDFGWFYFLTKPFLYLLDWLGGALGSIGLAILAFTVLLKLVTLPLSIKSYRAMARMKLLQPEMKRIQERFKEDKMRQSQEMMELYKREKVNPAAGCLPILIQIPIFFALYKVLYVGIEMRQAPFYGWIKDLSLPDPSSALTFFGLVPWDVPVMLHIGAWPILMGISMYLQQKLSPQPPDKMQARIFMVMPFIFTYMLAQMPAGLVIYWTWSNLLSIAQQWYMLRHAEPKK